MRTAAVALLLVLAACSGGSSGSDAAPTASAPAAGVARATVPPPTGDPAPEVLSRFRCERDSKGRWNAAGYLANDGKAKATYQVTVHVGGATGVVERARTRQVKDVAPGGSVRFTVKNVPAPDDGGACRVQVVVTT